VLSPHPLELHATLALLMRFHRALDAGAAPSEALQRARAELSADPELGDEGLYTLVRAVGLAHRPVLETRPATGEASRIPLPGVALAVLALIVVLVAMRRRA
jgi:hypothetical protein